ncbi:MAG TPA: PLP-dependent aminotransferase family protein [Magnetovibrio sp.]
MTIYTPNLDGRNGPKYRIIAEAMAEDIRRGVLAPGTKLPTHRDLAYRVGVTVGTITRVYQELQRRGFTGGRVGSGTFVMQPSTARPSSTLLEMCGEQPDFQNNQESWWISRHVIAESNIRDNNEINLGMNRPPSGPESKALARTLAELAQADGLEMLTRYNPAPGMPHHREAMADFLDQVGLTTNGNEVLLTHGAQHAIAATVLTLIKAGDVVLTEELTYPGFASLVTSMGAKIRPVAMDTEGIMPDALEAAIQATGARAAYLVPILQNPTVATMSLERLHAIADIAKRHNLTIIEDDVYGFQPETRNPPLAEIAPDHTVYINGFAKSFAPGLRVGVVRPPKTLFNMLSQSVQITGWMIAPLMGEIVTRWIRSGEAHTIMQWHRDEMRARNAIASELLDGFKLRHVPESLHLWLDLPDSHNAIDVIQAMHERGVVLVGSDSFTAGSTATPNCLRLCLGAPKTRAEVTTALTHLRDILDADSVSGIARHDSMVM